MNLNKIIISLCLIFNLSVANSQDMHLSMYDAAPLFLNPAFTGVIDGSWRVHGQYRTQWKAVNFKPYTTGLISFDMPYKKWGIGGQISNYRAGFGNYNVLQALFSAGYTVPLEKNKNHMLSFGLQGGLSQKSVEYQLHTFDNQYTTTNGGGFDNGLANGENFGSQSLIVPELNTGLVYYYAKQQSFLNPFVGVSVFNLLTPKETFFSADNNLPMRIYAHLGTRINLTDIIYVIPKVLYMHQEKFQELTFAAEAGFYLKPSELYLIGGLTYRNKDAFALSIGAKKANYVAKIAYDINSSSLVSASSGRGAFEISFTYTHQNNKHQKVKICPRL